MGLVGASLLATGCGAGGRQAVRSKPPADPTSWSESSLSSRAETDSGSAGGTRGFFKASRLPGAMSSEGEEIERSLGVGR